MGEHRVPPEVDGAGELLLQMLTRISWSLDSKFGPDFTYVIGNNGTGKSHLLAALADQLAYSAAAANVVCISNSLYDRFKPSGPEGYLYLGARSSSNAIFRSSLDRQLFHMILMALRKDRRRLKVLMNALDLDFEFLVMRYVGEDSFRRAASRKDRTPPAQKSIGAGFIGRKHRFDELSDQEIEALLGLVPLKPTIAVTVFAPGGDPLKFSVLSSGEQNRILLLAKVVAAVDADTVLLIDEPEISLHLHWQMDFHRSLKDLLKGFKKTHVVVATHSPILISEAAREDPNSQTNAVAIVERVGPLGRLSAETSVDMVPIRYTMHSFADVASHDQLVLRYFQTAPYQGREVSVEVADALLDVAEGKAADASVEVLRALKKVQGLNPDDRRHIEEAMQLIEQGVVASVTRELREGDVPADEQEEA